MQGNEAIFLPSVGGAPAPLNACTGVGPPVIPAPDPSHQYHHHHHHHHGPSGDISGSKIAGKKAKSSVKKKDLDQQDLIDKRSDLFSQLDASGVPSAGGLPPLEGYTASVDLDSETESNHDTALTLACAGGHEELVKLLLDRGADIGN